MTDSSLLSSPVAPGVREVRVVRTRAELRTALATLPRPLGLVPTMGWLHAGHRSLMARSRAESAATVVTIFVNPRQFNVAADYTKYPRNEARDLAIAEAEGVDLVAADHAYFGQKDAQQVMVIRQMARDLAIGTEVIACPTVREPDGLALSSRNVHLSPEQRAAAPVLHRALLAARGRWEAGERSAVALRDVMWETLTTEPLAEVDYVSVADGISLAELDRIDGPALLSLAVRFGTTRLIDNEPLGTALAPA